MLHQSVTNVQQKLPPLSNPIKAAISCKCNIGYFYKMHFQDEKYLSDNRALYTNNSSKNPELNTGFILTYTIPYTVKQN